MILPFRKAHSYISFIKLLNFRKFTKIPITKSQLRMRKTGYKKLHVLLKVTQWINGRTISGTFLGIRKEMWPWNDDI